MGITVNVSGKEASSAPMDPVPSGKYRVIVSDTDLVEIKNGKNAGKPYAALELTIAEIGDEKHDKYAGRKFFANVMLFSGALYSAVQIMKALGHEVSEGDLEFPDLDELLSEEFVVKVNVQGEREYTDAEGNKKTADPRNEVKGWYSRDTQVAPGREIVKAGAASSGGGAKSPYAQLA